MSIKYKVLGFAAAAAMTLGVAGSASADTTSATLNPNTPGGQTCNAAATGSNVDFGTYTYDGSGGYTAPSGTQAFDLNVTNTLNPNDCNVTVLGSDLTRAGGTQIIPVGAVSLDATAITGGHLVDPLSTSDQALLDDVAPDTYSIVTELDVAQLAGLPTGTYNGTITFTATEVTP